MYIHEKLLYRTKKLKKMEPFLIIATNFDETSVAWKHKGRLFNAKSCLYKYILNI